MSREDYTYAQSQVQRPVTGVPLAYKRWGKAIVTGTEPAGRQLSHKLRVKAKDQVRCGLVGSGWTGFYPKYAGRPGRDSEGSDRV